MHSQKLGYIGVDIVVHPDFQLSRMFPVNPSRILYNRSLPGKRHGKEERIESRIVETFTKVTARCRDKAYFIIGYCCKPLHCFTPFFGRQPAAEYDEMLYIASQLIRKYIQMFFPIGQKHRRPSLLDGLPDISKNKSIPLLICNKGGKYFLNRCIGIVHTEIRSFTD